MRHKERDRSHKTTCCMRGKTAIFRRGGIKFGFGPKNRSMCFPVLPLPPGWGSLILAPFPILPNPSILLFFIYSYLLSPPFKEEINMDLSALAPTDATTDRENINIPLTSPIVNL